MVHSAATETLHVTPNRSVSMPNPALHADAARGSTIVASAARASQYPRSSSSVGELIETNSAWSVTVVLFSRRVEPPPAIPPSVRPGMS